MSTSPQPKTKTPACVIALARILHARDYHAEHGHYPPEFHITSFDDWAADIADATLTAHGYDQDEIKVIQLADTGL